MKQIAIAFCLFGFALLFSCKEKQGNNDVRNLSAVADSAVIPTDSSTLYFPANKFLSDTSQLDKFRNIWYSKMLFALHEPTLFNNLDSFEVFRFTWLRTFHNPISIRVNKNRDQCILTLKIAEGSSGYEVGKLIKDTSFFITINEWKGLVSRISETNFWNLKFFMDDGGKDGSEWILEGKNKDKYHFVSRWTPNVTRYKEFKDCCDYLIQLSNLQLTDKENY